jgi:hypothetical protein
MPVSNLGSGVSIMAEVLPEKLGHDHFPSCLPMHYSVIVLVFGVLYPDIYFSTKYSNNDICGSEIWFRGVLEGRGWRIFMNELVRGDRFV